MPALTSSDDIRQAFIDFFVKKHAHTFVPASPVVPHNDPTLLFTNAGMNQFKPCFLEQVEPGSYLEGLKRATNSQKCIRAGGKHNDLDDVGKDTYHHTFFEMLGNWSVGDYFKHEAIDWAWEFLTDVCGLSPDRLYTTYFEGNPEQGLEPDHEARELWRKHLPEDHILPGDMKDNFWEMGETGPCGPCSEIHYDRIGGRNAASLVNMDDPDVLEVWNLVFIQFNREGPTTLKPLPNKHVDTGMGLERLVSVLNDVRSNYDTDIFTPLFDKTREITGARPYAGKLGAEDEGSVDMAYRVIADHVRTLSVSIADGAVPSNEGRGYVLRRVLRRAVRYGRQMLGAETGFISQLAPTVCERLGKFFPELQEKRDEIVGILLDEEQSFGRTLDKGIKHFDELATGKEVSGEAAFTLYDTFGFPLDLTQQMAEERGMGVDVAGYERCMEEQKERSRAGSKFGTGEGELALKPDELARLAGMGVEPTQDHGKYEPGVTKGVVKAIFDGDDFDEHADSGKGLRKLGVILDATGFYAEAGGQTTDTGDLDGPNGSFRVEHVKSFGGIVMHIGTPMKGEIRVGDSVACRVDRARRDANAKHHTATHLLNLALREVLGDHIDQKGSLVDPERLRFDFSHNKPVDPAELDRIEAMVREGVANDLEVDTRLANLADAQKIKTLRAVFGETYPDPVRVVSIGAPVVDLLERPEDPAYDALSVEFCGGTHLGKAGEIGDFALVAETGIAKGVRRVEAVAGVAATAAIHAADGLAQRIDQAGVLPVADLEAEAKHIAHEIDALTLPIVRRAQLQKAMGGLQDRLKAAAKERAAEARKLAVEAARVIAADAKASGEAFVVAKVEAGEDRQALQAAAAAISDTLPDAPVLVLSTTDEKVAIFASSPKAAHAQLKAGDWIKEVAPVVGGKGGGKPDQAQGGGTDPAKADDALEAARTFAQAKLAQTAG